jgi:hypothetical protein
MKKLGWFGITSLLFISLLVNATEFDSSYSSIESRHCKLLESDSMGNLQACPSFRGIKVNVIEGDLRQTINLIRRNKVYPLNLWSKISPAFSFLGTKIEWRHSKGKPRDIKGIIVRFNASEDMSDAAKTTSYLAVVKINAKTICVVGKIAPQAKQNQKARNMLDRSLNMPCF